MDPETQEAILKNYEAQKYDHDHNLAPKKEKSRKKTPKRKSDNESNSNEEN